MKRRLVILIFILILLGAVWFVFFMPRSSRRSGFTENRTLAAQILDCHKKPSPSGRAVCYDELFGSYLQSRASEFLISDFSGAMKEEGAIRSDCHQIAHAIGRAVLGREKTITLAFEKGRGLELCGGGFFHGAIEKMFRAEGEEAGYEHISPKEFLARAPTVCDIFMRFSHRSEREECIHGVGHSALYVLGSAKDAANLCRLYHTGQDVFSCASGVFMEYHFEKNDVRESKNLSEPCGPTAPPFRQPCFYVLAFGLVALNKTPEEIIGTCEKEKSAAGEMCIRGYAIFFLAHKALGGGNEPIVKFCESLSDASRRACFEGVAARLSDYSQNGANALPFCSRLALSSDRKDCFGHTAFILSVGFQKKVEETADECAPYAGKFARECRAAALSMRTMK